MELEHEHRFVVIDGVRLHYVEAGEGPLVVLLHGFPEFWWSWRHQIPALVAAGYRVVAPDQRGYAQSDKPRSWRDYRIERLAADVAGLITALGEERAFVVGHDWGAAVAWMVATLHPERVERLAILNVPHPDTMLRTLQRSPKQLLHSWYMFFFQIPWLPEHLLGWGGRRALASTYKDARPGAFTSADIGRYVEALRGPEGFRGPINWYRAALRQSPRRARALYRPIPARVLVIWGEQDRFLTAAMADSDPRLVPDVRVVRLPDASHWVQHDEPERVNALLTEFLSAA
ncbi:Epoxide hydrolase A [Baekduia alba]|uniref:alpha/beta fold hydrolase n=1 Tax=Baekduia alba TaxID=2997333 RepID=UPI002340E1DD|nr:alpha/beta fold hydrolase [Baekduia alba]WCB92792.1 Epoxide hydrolase A [Baekduia alba]